MKNITKYNKCKEVAKLYNSRSEFQHKNKNVYMIAYYYKWLDDVCSHMIELHKPKGYWNYERCKTEALKYNSKYKFEKGSPSAYGASKINNWYDDICQHMKPLGNLKKRCIYADEFPDKSIYIGLTYDFKKRHIDRNSNIKDSVSRYKNKTGLEYEEKQLTDYIPIEEAIEKEACYVEQYRKDGWNVLNRAKTGAIGTIILKWTFEACKKEALKYDTYMNFKRGVNGAYQKAYNNKWLDNICSHMNKFKNKYWTKEQCKNVALKCSTRLEFSKKYGTAYNLSRKNKWIDEICEHMNQPKKPAGYWSFNKCKDILSSCKTKYEFRNLYSCAYAMMYYNDELRKIYNNLPTKKRVITKPYKKKAPI